MNLIKIALPLVLLVFSSEAIAVGNTSNQSFNKAKKMLERQVDQDHRVTIYCGAEFDAKKNILAPVGFATAKYVKRSKRVEWEHVVPAALLIKSVLGKPIPRSFTDTNSLPDEQAYLVL